MPGSIFAFFINNRTPLPSPVESIYVRNLNGENFIELWFNKHNRLLREVIMITLDKTSVQKEASHSHIQQEDIYDCMLREGGILEFSQPMRVYKSNAEICISWSTDKEDVRYFYLADNLAIGIDGDDYLIAILLKKLSDTDIAGILGE